MIVLKLTSYFTIFYIIFILISGLDIFDVYSQPDRTDDDKRENSDKENEVEVYDQSVEIQLIYDGFDSPLYLGFAGPNDILVFEKQGFIKRVIDGDLVEKPLLKLDTEDCTEIFMKGIISKDITKGNIVSHYIFLYYTQCKQNDNCNDLVYRYELDDEKNLLINPVLLFSLESFQDSIKDKGIIRLGPDNNLYLNIENFQKELGYDDTITYGPAKKEMSWMECFIQTDLENDFNSILESQNVYIGSDDGHGLSDPFGADFDPYSGTLWYLDDEVNNGSEIRMLVQPIDNNSSMKMDLFKNVNKNENFLCTARDYSDDLKYTEEVNIPLKSLLFLHSHYLGKKNTHNLLVSSNTNQIFEYDLDRNRNNLKIINDSDSERDTKGFVFAEGFNGLLHVRVNPYDGLLYILDKKTDGDDDTKGTIYRIEEKTAKKL